MWLSGTIELDDPVWAPGHHKYFCSGRLGLLCQTGAWTVNEDRVRRQQVRKLTLKQARGLRHSGNRCGAVARLLKPPKKLLAKFSVAIDDHDVCHTRINSPGETVVPRCVGRGIRPSCATPGIFGAEFGR